MQAKAQAKHLALEEYCFHSSQMNETVASGLPEYFPAALLKEKQNVKERLCLA